MKNIEPFADRTLITDRPERDIDALLRDFFQRQLPDPWPVPPLAKEKSRATLLPMRPARRRTQTRRYLSLAAALAVFVLGYWALGKVFPDTLPGPDFLNPKGTIVKDVPTPSFLPDQLGPFGVDLLKPVHDNTPEMEQTKSGKKVQVFKHQEGNTTIFKFEYLPKQQTPSGK